MKRSEFLDKAVEAAAAAAGILRHYYQRNVAVQIKADRTPVTVADIECEEAIGGILRSAFPGHGFIGEETGASDADAEYLWLVDPLDGTRSFVRGYPFFSTQIALMHRGRLVLGVSSAPIFEEIACAERGAGATLNDQPISVSDIATLSECTLSTGNIHTLAAGPRWGALGNVIAGVARIRGYGDFYHYHLLASGRIDAIVESDVNILDIAALSVIVEEAGGRFTDLDGAPVGLETTSVLATNAALYDPLGAALRSV